MKKLNKISLAIAGLLFVAVSQASTEVVIIADTDNTGDGGVFIRSEGGAPLGSYLFLYDNEGNGTGGSENGVAALGGAARIDLNAPITNINGNTAVSGTFSSAGNASLNGGTTTINSNGGAAEITVTNGNITSIGNFNQTGATSITGTLTNTGNATLGTAGNTVNTMGNAGTSTNSLLGNINNLTATGANSTNNISASVNSMTATTRNDINAPVNNMGVDTVSQNTIGNNLAATTVTSRAGNATQALSNGFANTTVNGGQSGLANAVDPSSSQVLLSNAGGTTVDAHGKIIRSGDDGYVAPTSPTAAFTVTNGYGNTHGLVVTESQTTLSGGTQSSSLTLNDRAATFSNAQTGAPITVTGVADGKADFDAVNVRQFAGAIAGVTAMASIPAPQPGQSTSVGVGVGHFMNKSALAFGFNHKVSANTLIKGSVASGLNGGAKPMVGFGASWGF